MNTLHYHFLPHIARQTYLVQKRNMQQWHQLQSDGTEHPNPRQRTLTALREFILPLTQGNHEIIVMMDANSPANDDAIENFFQHTNLHDVTAPFLPDAPPLIYQCGQHKIDHIWGTPGVLTATIGASILPFGSGPKLSLIHI